MGKIYFGIFLDVKQAIETSPNAIFVPRMRNGNDKKEYKININTYVKWESVPGCHDLAIINI